MSGLDPTAAYVATVTAVPATLAAFYAARGKRYSKDAAATGHANKGTLHELSNGVMDQKIYDAVTRVLEDRPELVTDAQIVRAAVQTMLRRNSDLSLAEAVERIIRDHIPHGHPIQKREP